MFVPLEIVPYPAADLFAVTIFLHEPCQSHEVSVLLQNLLSEHELDKESFRYFLMVISST